MKEGERGGGGGGRWWDISPTSSSSSSSAVSSLVILPSPPAGKISKIRAAAESRDVTPPPLLLALLWLRWWRQDKVSPPTKHHVPRIYEAARSRKVRERKVRVRVCASCASLKTVDNNSKSQSSQRNYCCFLFFLFFIYLWIFIRVLDMAVTEAGCDLTYCKMRGIVTVLTGERQKQILRNNKFVTKAVSRLIIKPNLTYLQIYILITQTHVIEKCISFCFILKELKEFLARNLP